VAGNVNEKARTPSAAQARGGSVTRRLAIAILCVLMPEGSSTDALVSALRASAQSYNVAPLSEYRTAPVVA